MDIEVTNHGSVFLLHPRTDEGHTWLHANTGNEALWHGKALTVEARFIDDILTGAEMDGLGVGGDWLFDEDGNSRQGDPLGR